MRGRTSLDGDVFEKKHHLYHLDIIERNHGRTLKEVPFETGTFLTRDPIGYWDGPNVYCYVHCNPITHFDAFGLADGDTMEDYQDQMDAVDDQIEDEWENYDEEWEGDELDDFLDRLDGLDDQKEALSQSQADLKASGWSRDGVDSVSGPRVVDGKPVIKGDISSQWGSRGKATRDAKPNESHLFKTGSDGSLSAKTFEERSKETVDAINTTAGAIDKNFEPLMKAAASTPFVLVGGTLAVNGGKAVYAYGMAHTKEIIIAGHIVVRGAEFIKNGNLDGPIINHVNNVLPVVHTVVTQPWP